MEWTDDVTAGTWIRERLDPEDRRNPLHHFVPRGFPAYARISNAASGPAEGDEDAAQEGRLDAAKLSAVTRHLAQHTRTADDVYIAVWEGWGGLVGSFASAPARIALATSDDDDPAVMNHHRAMLERSIHDPFNNVFRKPVWQPGLLSDDISRGPRLELPDRDHVLFRGSLGELADPGWASRVPWAEDRPEWTASPSLIWPADRAWVLVTEVDDDSTTVGGSPDLVRALCSDPAIEGRAIRADTSLSGNAAEVNR